MYIYNAGSVCENGQVSHFGDNCRSTSIPKGAFYDLSRYVNVANDILCIHDSCNDASAILYK